MENALCYNCCNITLTGYLIFGSKFNLLFISVSSEIVQLLMLKLSQMEFLYKTGDP